MRLLPTLAIAGAAVLGFGALGRATTTDRSAFPSDEGAPENPFPECPKAPNCVRVTRLYDTDEGRLWDAAREAALSAGRIESEDVGARKLAASCRVGLFTDDLLLAVEPHKGGAALHLRTASRVGYSDLGVNGRRAREVLASVDAALAH